MTCPGWLLRPECLSLPNMKSTAAAIKLYAAPMMAVASSICRGDQLRGPTFRHVCSSLITAAHRGFVPRRGRIRAYLSAKAVRLQPLMSDVPMRVPTSEKWKILIFQVIERRTKDLYPRSGAKLKPQHHNSVCSVGYDAALATCHTYVPRHVCFAVHDHNAGSTATFDPAILDHLLHP